MSTPTIHDEGCLCEMCFWANRGQITQDSPALSASLSYYGHPRLDVGVPVLADTPDFESEWEDAPESRRRDNDTLDWCAKWIEDSLRAETNERTIEFGKNMAMTLRAAKTDSRVSASTAPQRQYSCSCGGALTAEEYITHYFELGHDRGVNTPSRYCEPFIPAASPEVQVSPDADAEMESVAETAAEIKGNLYT